MKRAASIGFLTLYLLANTELLEFTRLPILFEHFAEHKQADLRITFIDFMMMHYFGHDINDFDDDRDQQLPFRGLHCEHVSASSLALPDDQRDVQRSLTDCPGTKGKVFDTPF